MSLVKVTTPKNVRRRIPQWALHPNQKLVENKKYFLRTIGRAIDVLDAFDGNRVLSLKDLSKQTELPEPTLFRVLFTLEQRGYLIQAVDGTYQLAPKLRVGWQTEDASSLRKMCRPQLEFLTNKFNETVSVAYLLNDRIQVLDCVETFHEIRISNRIGRVLPPHCSAMGKVITAFQDRTAADQILEAYGLFPRTANTITDRSKLFEEFEMIRASGIGYDREESVLGGLCISAAIQPAGAPVLAAVSISTPLVRMTKNLEEDICHAVLEAAKNIATTLSKSPSGKTNTTSSQ
jgi:IclR family acetate operon transcriptional repressor